MPPAMNTSKKIVVRMALATGSTFATIIGAQSLAVQTNPIETLEPSDQAALLPTLATLPEATPVPTMAQLVDVNPQQNTPPTLTIQHTAPNLVILRQPGQSSQSLVAQQDSANTINAVNQPSDQQIAPPNNVQTVQIAPPQPIELDAPPPMVIQPDPIIVQPPPIVVQAPAPQSSNNDNNNSHNGGGGGNNHRSHSSR